MQRAASQPVKYPPNFRTDGFPLSSGSDAIRSRVDRGRTVRDAGDDKFVWCPRREAHANRVLTSYNARTC